MIELFEEAQRAALHAKRVTVIPKDINLPARMPRGTGDFLSALGIFQRGAW